MKLGAVEIPVLVVGITQIIKMLFPKLSEQGKIIIALVVGLVLLSLAEALPFVGDTVAQIIVSVVRVLGYAISIPGWFSVVKDDLLGR